jgi:uncharacterized protein YcnI
MPCCTPSAAASAAEPNPFTLIKETKTMKTKTTLAVAVCGALALPAAAQAHVTANPGQAPAGGYAKFDFRVPHGCEGKPTTAVTVRLPAGATSVKPQEVAGWRISTETGKLPQPVEQHGETITEGVREVTWRGGPLPDEHMQEFGLSLKLPDTANEGQTLYFPTVARCTGGAVERWIQMPSAGENPEELDFPAPAVVLTAAEDEHGGGASAGGTDSQDSRSEGTAAQADVDAAPAAAVSGGDGGGGDAQTLAIIALVVGGLGLAAGATGAMMARRARTA